MDCTILFLLPIRRFQRHETLHTFIWLFFFHSEHAEWDTVYKGRYQSNQKLKGAWSTSSILYPLDENWPSIFSDTNFLFYTWHVLCYTPRNLPFHYNQTFGRLRSTVFGRVVQKSCMLAWQGHKHNLMLTHKKVLSVIKTCFECQPRIFFLFAQIYGLPFLLTSNSFSLSAIKQKSSSVIWLFFTE